MCIRDRDEPRPVLSLMSMKSLEDMLPSDRFVRVHRSFIVQPEKIKVIERNPADHSMLVSQHRVLATQQSRAPPVAGGARRSC